MYKDIVEFIKESYPNKDKIALYEPSFRGNEIAYLSQAINDGYVSVHGRFLKKVEDQLKKITSADYVVLTNSGTSALHLSLLALGITKNDEVLVPSFTYVATSNAISYVGATSHFVDIERETLGICPKKLKFFLENHTEIRDEQCYNKKTNRNIRACIPVHAFGNPCKIKELREVCGLYNISIIEDAAEALGSTISKEHVGTFGHLGILSFNGNKIITSGGGGAVLTNDKKLFNQIRHLAAQAKTNSLGYDHDALGYNYKMNNLNAALLLAQLEQLNDKLRKKKLLHERYKFFFDSYDQIDLCTTNQPNITPNYWLNALFFKDAYSRDIFVSISNKSGVETRKAWTPLHMFDWIDAYNDGDFNITASVSEQCALLPSYI
ncbi:LegC family aminotransferase [Gangjinia marincola]|uniref:LegC family aminotransferase n=1 Tax=Gangjinia marincola TaxID=578463 RepID=A0ABP3XSK6_9FLAO